MVSIEVTVVLLVAVTLVVSGVEPEFLNKSCPV